MPPTTTVTKKTTIRKGYVRKGRMMKYRRQGLRRGLMNRLPTFTETCVLARITANAGGVFSVSMDQIPQLAQYSNLYRQYKINWAKFTLLSDTTVYDGTQTATGAFAPRVAWAINDTPNITAPASEADLLQDNGARVKPLLS